MFFIKKLGAGGDQTIWLRLQPTKLGSWLPYTLLVMSRVRSHALSVSPILCLLNLGRRQLTFFPPIDNKQAIKCKKMVEECHMACLSSPTSRRLQRTSGLRTSPRGPVASSPPPPTQQKTNLKRTVSQDFSKELKVKTC